MRVTKIDLTNFRGVAEFRGVWTGNTILLGRNGAGKTSILQAVAFVLTGEAFDQAGKRLKNADLIGPAGKQARVDLTIEHDGQTIRLCCTIASAGAKITVDGLQIQGTPDLVRTGLWASLRIDPRQAAVALNPRAYLVSDDLSPLLAQGKIEEASLWTLFGSGADVAKAFLSAQGIVITTVTDIDRAYKAAYDHRTGVNRRIKDLTGEVKAMAALTPPMGPAGPIQATQIPAVEEQLSMHRAKRDKLLTQLGGLAKSRTREEIASDLLAAIKRLEAIPLATVPPENNDALRNAEQAHAALVARQSTIVQQAKDINRRLAALQGGEGGTCPTCGQKIKDLAGLEKEAVRLAAESTRLNGAVAEALKALEPIRQEVSRAAQVTRKAETDRRAAEMAIAQLKAEQPRGDTTAIQAEIDGLTERISKGDAILTSLRAIAATDARVAELKDLKKESEDLSMICDVLGAPTAKACVCGDAKAAFELKANEALARFGYEVRIVTGATMHIEARRPDGEWVPAVQLSDGEMVMCEIALAEAYAGGTLAIVDRLDSLDGWQKASAIGLIREGTCGWLCAAAWSQTVEPDMAALTSGFNPMNVEWVG